MGGLCPGGKPRGEWGTLSLAGKSQPESRTKMRALPPGGQRGGAAACAAVGIEVKERFFSRKLAKEETEVPLCRDQCLLLDCPC